MPERSAACPAIMLTTLQPMAEGGWDHDHGCKLTPGHADLHECFKCGAKWLSKTALIDGSVYDCDFCGAGPGDCHCGEHSDGSPS